MSDRAHMLLKMIFQICGNVGKLEMSCGQIDEYLEEQIKLLKYSSELGGPSPTLCISAVYALLAKASVEMASQDCSIDDINIIENVAFHNMNVFVKRRLNEKRKH